MNDDVNSLPERKSKTQRKREAIALQALGEQLVKLTEKQLQNLSLDPLLLTAILQAKTFKSHGALHRQLQYIGKLMRSVDPQPIQQALTKLHTAQGKS